MLTSKKVRLGFDLGGTKLQPYMEYEDGTPVINRHGGAPFICEEDSHWIDKVNDSEEVKKRKITDLMLMQLEEHMYKTRTTIEQISFVGIVVPGPVKDNKIETMVNIGLEDYDIIEDFKREAHKKGYSLDIPMVVANDYTGAVYGEYKKGVAQGEEGKIVALGFGTGTGGALMKNGEIIENKRGTFGELGHQGAKWINEKKKCNCGNMNCIETYTAMRPMFAQISEYVWSDEVLSGVKIKEMLHAQRTRYKYSVLTREAFEIYSKWLDNIASAYAQFADKEKPSLMLMFGSILHLITDDEFEELVQKVKDRTTYDKFEMKKSKLGSLAPAIGASLLKNLT